MKDVRLERLHRALGRFLAPERPDELIRGDRPVGLEGKDPEQNPLLGRESEGAPAQGDADRSENADLHGTHSDDT